MPRARRTRSLIPYTWVPQVYLKMLAASPVSSAIAAAARLVARVGPHLDTSVMAPVSSAPAKTAAATCTWLTAVCAVPGWSFGATPARMHAAP